MPFDPSNFLLPMTPASKMDFADGIMQAQQNRMKREELRRLQAQLEETKRANKEEERLREMAEKGAMARAQLEMDMQNQRHAAQAQEKQEEAKRAAYGQFSALTAKRDYEGAEAYIPALEMLGMGVDVTRSSAGFPSYRIHENAAEDARLEEQLQGQAWQNAERPIYGNPYDGDLRAAELAQAAPLDETGMYGQMPGTPPPAPEEPGLPQWDDSPKTGHVLDTQLMQDQTLQRLNPSLKANVEAYPDYYRGQATSAAEGAAASGLNVEDSLNMFRNQLAGPVELAKAQFEANAKQQEKGELNEVQKSGMRKTGRQATQTSLKTQGIEAAINTLDLADRVVMALSDNNTAVQSQAGQLLVQLGQVKGVPSDKELGLALGDSNLSAFDAAGNWIETKVKGGFPTKQREGLIKWAKAQKDKEQSRLYQWLEAQELASGENPNQYEREGMQEVIKTLPASALAGYAEWKKKRKGAKGGSPQTVRQETASNDPEDVEDELLIHTSDYGFDVDAVRPLMSTESTNDPNAKNPGSSASGLFQFTDQTAKDMGLKDAAAYRALPPSKQIELAMKRFKKLGLDENSTADDFAMANAAPGYINAKPGTVIEEYRSGTELGDEVRAKNPGWIPAGGGEITNDSILDFYRKRRGERTPAVAPARSADTQKKVWTPKNEEERKIYRQLYGKDPD